MGQRICLLKMDDLRKNPAFNDLNNLSITNDLMVKPKFACNVCLKDKFQFLFY